MIERRPLVANRIQKIEGSFAGGVNYCGPTADNGILVNIKWVK